eukprot:gene29516-5867_t
MATCMAASSGFGVLNRGLRHPGSYIRATTHTLVDHANTKLKPTQTNPACKPQRQQVKVQATPENVDQDKAGNKNKKPRSFTKAAPIPQEERAAELAAIHEELVTDLGMSPEVATKVSGGREEENIEVLRVLQEAGLESDQVMDVLQKFPAVLLVRPAYLVQRLACLANMGFPPGCDGGPLLKKPMILNASLQFNNVEWLAAKGFPEHLIRKMILRNPNLLMFSPEESLGPMLEYVAWVTGSNETAVDLLSKQPTIFGRRPTSIHATLVMLAELVGCSPSLMLTRNVSAVTYSMHTRIGPRCIILRELGLAEDAELMYKSTWLTQKNNDFATWPTLVEAYHDMGRERFPTTNSFEDAIVVCQERWDYKWKAKFDERSLMMQAAWKESGIAGLSNIEDLMCGEE